MRNVFLAIMLLLAGRASATGEINVLTDLYSPFPPGCIALSLPEGPASASNTLYDETIWAPGIGSGFKDAQLRVQIWRTGCHDPGYSVVMVRLTKLSGPNPVLVPQVFADVGSVDEPWHQGQLIRHPAVGNVGASGNVISEFGTTFMLAVDPISIDGLTDFFPEDYNDLFTLELFWGGYAPNAAPLGELFDILPYEPSLDPPQFNVPLLHGRMTGQYQFDGMPSTGLQLLVNERSDDTNFIFATLFTYLNGEPFWLVGNTEGEAPGFPWVELDMLRVTGGQFFGLGPNQFSQSDVQVDVVGTLLIEALDCNTLLVGYDFSPLGLGSGVIEGHRDEFSIAGYACNPW
jgi:hypothetical protein